MFPKTLSSSHKSCLSGGNVQNHSFHIKHWQIPNVHNVVKSFWLLKYFTKCNCRREWNISLCHGARNPPCHTTRSWHRCHSRCIVRAHRTSQTHPQLPSCTSSRNSLRTSVGCFTQEALIISVSTTTKLGLHHQIPHQHQRRHWNTQHHLH